VSAATFEVKYADFVTADGQVDGTPITLRNALPGDDNTLVGKSAQTVFVGSELGDATRAFKFAFMVVLLGEWKEEPFFARIMFVSFRFLLETW
jgi:hypothetical protein